MSTRIIKAVWLGEDIGLAQELGSFFGERGVAMEVALADSRAVAINGDVAFAYLADPSIAGGVLHAPTSLRTLVWPPLVAVVSRSPSKSELERMRRQGVVHVCREIDTNFGNVVRRLLDPGVCGRRRLQAGMLSEALLAAEKSGASGLLAVSCPHWDAASSYPWENSSLFYCGEQQGGKCSGWAGRIYIVGGAITLAETPTTRGAHALQQMLQLGEGTLMRFPFYLSPETTDPLGPPSVAMIRPAEATETAQVEKLQRSEIIELASPRPPRGAPSRTSPPPLPKEPSVLDLDSLLATSPSFVGAVRFGVDGNPIDAAGDIDAAMHAAIAHMAFDQAYSISAALPLGSVLGFAVGGRSSSCFVRRSAKTRSSVSVSGGATQTPNRTLAELGRLT
jgi:hypothetical protein